MEKIRLANRPVEVVCVLYIYVNHFNFLVVLSTFLL